MQAFIAARTPPGWKTRPLWALFRRRKRTGFADEELLSVYRDHGVIPKSSRDDNHNKESEDLSGYQLVTEGALVTNKMKAWQGSIAISRFRGIVSPAYYVYEPLSDECDQFLHYLLRSEPYIALYGRISKGVRVNQWDLEHESLRNVPVMLPDLATQKSIADFLDRETARIDQLIAKKERLAATLAEREEAAFLGVVTGQDHSGPKVYSGVDWIGDIPAHWSAPKFTYIARQETGHTPSRKEPSYWVPQECVIPWFSLADVWQIREHNRIYVSETAEKISQIGMENSAARLLPRHTVVLSRTASVGFPAILDVPMAVTQDFVGWICGPQVRPKFLYYVLRSMKPVFRSLMMGSTHQTIYMPDLRAFRLPLPPLNEQDAITAELDRSIGSFRVAAEKIVESVGKLREYRASVITSAVTGQIEIREKMPAVSSRPDRSKFRVTIGAEIVRQHQGNPKFGRVKLQKELYLAETHLGIDGLQGNYLREAAGPLDRALIEETEGGLEAAGFYRASQRDGTGTTVTYLPLANAGQHKAELETLLGSKTDELRSLIAMLHDLDRREVEAVATLYAVWNDALMDSQDFDDAAIINGVLTEWHTEKSEKFKSDDLSRWLGWMRRHGLTPRGEGPRTAHTATRDMFA
ncbi:restriction endonuclease subunit S [Rhizobium etli]|nr:restriction endonuclease subunit S [Rhizobium etli]